MTRTLLCAALLAAAPAAIAQDSDSPFSGSVALFSDYVFRGLSQTDEKPALQGSFTYTHDSGLYAGVWVSNVDFGDGFGSGTELDTYIGFGTQMTDQLGLDLQLVRYNYAGLDDNNAFEYNELLVNVNYNEIVTGTIGWSNDVFASGENGLYLAVGASYPLSEALAMNANVGRYSLPGEIADYMDFGLGLSYELAPVSLSLNFIGTDGDARDTFGPVADNRVVAGVTFEF